MGDEDNREPSIIVAKVLFWPALLFPNARSGEVAILCLLGLLSWFVAFVFGVGFLVGWSFK